MPTSSIDTIAMQHICHKCKTHSDTHINTLHNSHLSSVPDVNPVVLAKKQQFCVQLFFITSDELKQENNKN